MAIRDNEILQEGSAEFDADLGAAYDKGDYLLLGTVPLVCVKGSGDTDEARFATRGVFELPVVAQDHLGNNAVADGDVLYLDGADINVDAANGVRFGVALGSVGAGLTATIKVLLAPCTPTYGIVK